MTTAHRATFTHAKAKDTSLSQTYQASLVHKRFLPAHTQLKYRVLGQNRSGADGGADGGDQIARLKENLLRREHEHSKARPEEEEHRSRRLQLLQDTRHIDNDSDEEEGESGHLRQLQRSQNGGENKDGSDGEQSGGSGSNSGSDDSDDSGSSEDEAERLLQELQKIKDERARLDQQKKDAALEKQAMSSNPLLNFDEKHKGEDTTQKRGWRGGTLFSTKRNKLLPNTNTENYVNDMVHSDFHRRFLDKYVR